jgi:hypothetical protein
MSGTNITQVQVFQQTPGAPSTLQKTGAFISQGGTNTSPGTRTLLTQASSLTPVLTVAKTLSGVTQTTGTATATATSAHGFTVGDTLYLTIAGATGSTTAYNGTFLCTITTTTEFTYAVPSGTATPATGSLTYIPLSATELNQMVTTFFAQAGANQAVYVLEYGPGNAADGTTFLAAWITANPGIFYLYVVPREWDGTSGFLSLIASYESTTAKTYFLTTTTLATYQSYTSGLMKDVLALIEAPAYGAWSANALTAIAYTSGGVPAPFTGSVSATTTTAHGVAVGQWFQISGCTPAGYNGWFQAQPGTTGETLVYYVLAAPGAESVLGTLVVSYYSSAGIGTTEFSIAAVAYVILNYAPASANKVPPLNLAYLYGVTPFPTQANSALLTTLNTANVNVVGTGASGGISTALVDGGNTMDGNQFLWWYSIDWMQINMQLNVNNYVINGSNNPAAPVYLNQAGINGGQAVAASTADSAIAFGLGLGTVTETELTGTQLAAALAAGTYNGNIIVNAVPFASYYSLNENQYQKGIYEGYTVAYSPQVGFSSILFTIIASGFAAPPAA